MISELYLTLNKTISDIFLYNNFKIEVIIKSIQAFHIYVFVNDWL